MTMRRRGIGLHLTWLLAVAAAAQPVEFRAVKITNVDSPVMFSDRSIAEAMDYLAAIGINTILPVVWHQGYTLYPSGVLDSLFQVEIAPAFVGRDPLERILIEAHRNGMEVMPWFESGFSPSHMAYGTDGGHILRTRPDWALRNPDGSMTVKNGFFWMSAVNPEVQDFILALTDEILANYDVDGIEYSDRIPAMPVEGGYDSVTVARYQAEHRGASPPSDPRAWAWKRWRADQLNDFYARARTVIKSHGDPHIVSASPSLFPWSYEEYLQDSETWLNSGTIDNLVPQVYRYNLADYTFELNKALSYVPTDLRDRVFSGMLIKLGAYVIPEDFLLAAIQANRDRGVHGDVFFFYEGLRRNDDALGHALRNSFYQHDAVQPHRDGQAWRPKPPIVHEAAASQTGTWVIDRTQEGFADGILRAEGGSAATLTYPYPVPHDAWYDAYAFIAPDAAHAEAAHYTVFTDTDSFAVTLDQRSGWGWRRLGTGYWQAGTQRVARLSTASTPTGQAVAADAVMLLLNRKRSPDVFVTHTAPAPTLSPAETTLAPAYPNPFRTATTLTYTLTQPGPVHLTLHDVTGRTVATLAEGWQPAGTHRILFTPSTHLASGIYLARLPGGVSQRLVLLR